MEKLLFIIKMFVYFPLDLVFWLYVHRKWIMLH